MPPPQRALTTAVGLLTATLFVAPAASADPAPPGCTAGDLAQIASGVAAATSAYLFSHPDVNDFFTGLRNTPRDQLAKPIKEYMDAHPQTHADLLGIRQPIADWHQRCTAE